MVCCPHTSVPVAVSATALAPVPAPAPGLGRTLMALRRHLHDVRPALCSTHPPLLPLLFTRPPARPAAPARPRACVSAHLGICLPTFACACACVRQSDFAVELMEKHGIKPDLSTVVVVDEAGAHVRSTAALRVLLHCGSPYNILYYAFIWVPAPLRDLGYKAVAASRYQVFGKDETVCRRFTKDMRRRFLSPPSAA
eukprot:639909-Pleurochrysis_carterae.AAC.2